MSTTRRTATRRTVRWMMTIAVVGAPLAALQLTSSVASADGVVATLSAASDVAGPARATQPAVRVAGSAKSVATTTSSKLTFPIQATPPFNCEALNNFGAPRPGGRIHEGTDIMGTYKWAVGVVPNQEVYAVVDGKLGGQVVNGQPGSSLSGNSWRLYANTGKAYYMYAHLSRFADGLSNGSAVTRGQVIGYVGDTGDPGTGNFHLHFEVHPNGDQQVVDPLPLLLPAPATCRID